MSAAVETVGVVGAGTMGSGIAQLACLGGYATRLHDPIPEALENGVARLGEDLDRGARREMWSADEAEAAKERLTAVQELSGLAGCDLVIEAAPEDLELKRRLFAALADACGEQAILATNTSSLPVKEVGAETPHRERVVGMHFFNPPALMKLVEVVATSDSSGQALEATAEVGRRMGRTPIRAKDSPGFLANRLARPYPLESLRMLAEGVADVVAIDRAIRIGGGFRMGPFELIDLIGVDVNLSVARSFYSQGGEPARWRPSPIQEELVREGRFGRKSGLGFYAYDASDASDAPLHRSAQQARRPKEEPVGPTLDHDRLASVDPAAPEILERLFAQIANEAAFAREEEVGSRPDMDTAMRLGFNWPLGPIEIGELIGPARAVEVLERQRRSAGEAYAPAPLLAADAAREA